MLEIQCPGCPARLQVPETLRGQPIRCPKCRTQIHVNPTADDLPPTQPLPQLSPLSPDLPATVPTPVQPTRDEVPTTPQTGWNVLARLVSPVLVVLAFALLVSCKPRAWYVELVPSEDQTPTQLPTEARTDFPPPVVIGSDVDLIPGDALAVISIRPGDLWQSPLFQKIMNQAPADLHELIVAQNRRTRLDISDFERFTLVAMDGGSRQWGILKMTRPLAAERTAALRALLPITWESRKHKNRSYHLGQMTGGLVAQRPEPIALFPISDHITILGTELGVQAALDLLDAPIKTGPMSEIRNRIVVGNPHFLSAGTTSKADLDAWIQQRGAQPNPAPFKMPALRLATFTAQFSEPAELQVRFDCVDPAEAPNLAGILNNLKQFGGIAQMLEGQLTALGQPVPQAQAILLRFVNTLSTTTENASVTVTGKIDVAKVLPKFPEQVLAQVTPNLGQVSGKNHLDAIAAALQQYQRVNGSLPPAVLRDPGGKPLLSWRVVLLPYLGQGDLYRKFDLSKPWDDPANLPLLEQIPDVYRPPICPPGTTRTCYQFVTGPRTAFAEATPLVPARPGDTLLAVVTSSERAVPWTAPQDLVLPATAAEIESNGLLDHLGFWPVGKTFAGLMFDGQTQDLPRTISPAELLQQVASKTGP